MDHDAIREARTTMRMIHEHLLNTHLSMGVKCEHVGFMEVLHHPTSSYGAINYTTPRRNTAWVSGQHIKNGVQHLQSLKRHARVRFPEGLYPPIFIKNLRELGLIVEYEIPIMVFKTESSASIELPDTEANFICHTLDTSSSAEEWRSMQKNPQYSVMQAGIEPIYIGEQHQDNTNILDIQLRHDQTPIGIIRTTLDENTAHITAHAIHKDHLNTTTRQFIIGAALKEAINRNCKMVFISGEHESTRKICTEMGFINAGSVVSYAEQTEKTLEGTHGSLEESILIL